jgi:hypothetical protein
MRSKRQMAELTATFAKVAPLAPKPLPREWRAFERDLEAVLRANLDDVREFGWSEERQEFSFQIQTAIELDDCFMTATRGFELAMVQGVDIMTTIELAVDQVTKWRAKMTEVHRAIRRAGFHSA